ncbi:MAG: hypothetical protein QM493_12110 [Sulfurovum sp.]
MRIILTLIVSMYLLHASNTPKSNQLLVVTAKNWTTSSASLQRYTYKRNGFYKVGKPIRVKIGRRGLGWGIGLHKIPRSAKIIKREGDGKAPAGIFRLRQAFGYSRFSIKYPYRVYSRLDHCVDDSKSRFYNKIVDSSEIDRDYRSFEYMKLSKNYYKYGIVVDHNNIVDNKKSKRGAGSCIFIHIKSSPTAGCTAMSESKIKMIMRWLNPKANPLLVQGTKKDIARLMKEIRPL